MKIEQQNNNFQELDRRIEQLLTPHFTPSTAGLKLPTLQKSPRSAIWINILRWGGVSAALIIGVFVLVGPTNEVVAKTPEEVITEALASLQATKGYRVNFRAYIVPNRNGDISEPYKINPKGEEIEGVLTILKSEDKEYMRIEWGSEVVQLFDSEQMRYKMWRNGVLVHDEKRSSIILKLLELTSLNEVKAIFGGDEDVQMQIDEGGDFISLRLKTKHGKSELGGIFSRKQGQLLECGVRILNDAGEWEKVLSAKIEYDYVVNKEQITSSPK